MVMFVFSNISLISLKVALWTQAIEVKFPNEFGDVHREKPTLLPLTNGLIRLLKESDNSYKDVARSIDSPMNLNQNPDGEGLIDVIFNGDYPVVDEISRFLDGLLEEVLNEHIVETKKVRL